MVTVEVLVMDGVICITDEPVVWLFDDLINCFLCKMLENSGKLLDAASPQQPISPCASSRKCSLNFA